MSLLFNVLSRLVITFLPRSKCLLISWLQLPSAVISEPRKIKSATVSTVSPSICHEVMGPDAMILVFWMLSFKPTPLRNFKQRRNFRGLCCLVAQSCPTLCNPLYCSLPRFLCPWDFFRQAYWIGLPFPTPRNLPNPGVEPVSPALQVETSPTESSGKPSKALGNHNKVNDHSRNYWGNSQTLLTCLLYSAQKAEQVT